MQIRNGSVVLGQTQQPIVVLYDKDPDGCCAAAIIKGYYLEKAGLKPIDLIELTEAQITDKLNILFHPADYNKPVSVTGASVVYIVDFTPNKKDLKQLTENNKVIWIDHHKTNFHPEFKDLPGLRRTDKSGCRLTWEYLFKDQKEPEACKLIGDHDLFEFKFGDKSRWFVQGVEHFHKPARTEDAFGEQIKIEEKDLNNPNCSVWMDLLGFGGDYKGEYFSEVMSNGQTIYTAIQVQNKHLIEKYGYDGTFDGHKCLYINVPHNSYLGEYAYTKLKYPVVACYTDCKIDGKMIRKFTVYSNGTPHVGNLCKKRGGGGHSGCGGFSEKLL